jgi:hypothetical protein
MVCIKMLRMHNKSVCDLFYDTVDGTFKVLVDQSKFLMNIGTNCYKMTYNKAS